MDLNSSICTDTDQKREYPLQVVHIKKIQFMLHVQNMFVWLFIGQLSIITFRTLGVR